MTGDCFRGSNQVYNLADDLVDGKPHYVGATTPLHIYYDAADHVWLMDDDYDTQEIHAHMNSADTFPSVSCRPLPIARSFTTNQDEHCCYS